MGALARTKPTSNGAAQPPLWSSAARWPLAHGDLPSPSLIGRQFFYSFFDEICGGKRQAGLDGQRSPFGGRRGVVATAERGHGEGRFLVVWFGFAWRAGFLLLGRVAIS